MPISINNVTFSSYAFIIVFVFAILLSLRRKKGFDLFSLELTRELKGLAILAVVFSHVGYFLISDHRFLFPLSVMAGTGVNLFLFLSGYGLTMSSLKKKLPVLGFYKKRLLKLFTPFWIVLLFFLFLDYFVLHISYGPGYIAKSMLGIFPQADLFKDVNSPFWFLTPLLFYYLVFPWVFSVKRPWLTAALIFVASFFVLKLNLPVSIDILHLYKLHFLAFPLGVAFASLFFEPFYLDRFEPAKVKAFLYNLEKPLFLKAILNKLRKPNIFRLFFKKLKKPFYYGILTILLMLICYFAYYSEVGGVPYKEQGISLLVMGAIIFVFIMKKVEIRFLHLFGFYSYEIYLVHWPLMSRYDLLFKYLPASVAMALYLVFFLLISWGLVKLLERICRLKFS